EERRLSVELKIVFGFQDVVKDSEPSANTCFSACSGRPRKTNTWRPVILIREIRTLRSVGIAGKQDAFWRIWKNRRLLAQSPGEGASLQIEFRRIVFIPHAEGQHQVAADLPFILEESREIL